MVQPPWMGPFSPKWGFLPPPYLRGVLSRVCAQCWSGVSDPSGPIGWPCLMGDSTPSQCCGGQQWSRSALAPLWGDVPPEPSKPGKGLDCLGSPLLPSSFVPTPSEVNLGASTEPICIPECKELWGQHAPSITLGCAYVLETLSNVFHGSHFPHRGSCPFG